MISLLSVVCWFISIRESLAVDVRDDYNMQQFLKCDKDCLCSGINLNDNPECEQTSFCRCGPEFIVSNASVSCSLAIFDKCQEVNQITFEGNNYNCTDNDWLKFLSASEKKGVKTISNAKCSKQPSKTFLFQLAAWENCPERCECHTYDRSLRVRVDCSERNLFDHDLPHKIPPKTEDIFLTSNNLSDVTQWLEEILPHSRYLRRIELSDNDLQIIPSLPESEAPLNHIFLMKNSIKKLDYEAVESYLHYEGLAVNLKDNPWVCNCDTEPFVGLLRTNTILFEDYEYIMCKHEITSEIIRPWFYDYSTCSRGVLQWSAFLNILYWWDVLCLLLLNSVMIAVYINVRKCYEELLAGKVKPRVPWVHNIVERLNRYSFNRASRVKAYFWDRLAIHKYKN